MLFTSAVFAALATGGLAAALPGGNGGGWGYGQCKAWDYSSTCSKVYTTKTKSWVKPETSVYTTTTYKPSTVTLTSERTSYETKYSTIVKTHTKYETKTKTIPYKSESHTVVCYTKPVWVWTHSTSLYTSTEKYPVTSKTSSVKTEVTTHSMPGNPHQLLQKHLPRYEDNLRVQGMLNNFQLCFNKQFDD
ncbi:hypothetical protein LTR56_003042 [Elasticomyces elasticus]|nr:hypothetical protein LTR56_003042 [Elasticomyces elasticus]KAK3662104.1 hypothetical protein LTR22_007077 [Elasticomyces elasticus]KAK4927533.1 hypothetical protein LTR49_005673 [Elasticomyces elasticus]KAK5743693.1 hypothetical protein LTS12_023774 [Elasticomyces elasticus]